MGTVPVTLMVSPETAKVYQEATSQSRLKMEMLFELWARRVDEAERKPLEQRRREFREILAELRETVAANGLTPEILEEILSEK